MRIDHLLLWGIVVHLIADWLLQNQWMADNKASLRYPAAWVHSGIHFALSMLVFPIWGAAIIFVTHILIDTRVPLKWLTKMAKTPGPDTPVGLHVWLWRDQVMHIAMIALAALLCTHKL